MRGFSDEERDRIREELVATGREHLLTFGPEKTTVSDITDPVGIAKSTFYRFFDSKAELYLEIYRREQEAFFERAEAREGAFDDASDGLEYLFRLYIEYAEENPLVQKMVADGELEHVAGDVDRHKLEAVQRQSVERLRPFVGDLQKRTSGRLQEFDIPLLFGMMSVFGLLVIHREQYENYQEGYYDRIQDELISALATGLTVEEDE